MSSGATTAVQKDFVAVIEFLKTVRVLDSSVSQETITVAKKIHSSTYSLVLWKFRLRKLPFHSRPFIEEIASDALQILPQVLLGYGKTAKLLARGVLENTLRNIYFSDHPVEFAIMNQDKKWFMEIKALIDYLKAHPVFSVTEQTYDAINRLYSLYSELSAGIHGRKVADLEMRTALKTISYSSNIAGKDAESVRRCAEVSNFLLAVYHRKQMHKFSAEDRRIVLNTLPKIAKTALGNLDLEDAA